jgi:type I restriction enzyme, S subunit
MTDRTSSDWEERSLYSLAAYVNGRAFKPFETRSASGLPVVKIAELNRGIIEGTGRYVGHVEEKHRIRPGDVLFAWSGSIGIYSYRGPEAVLNQHIFKCQAVDGVSQQFLRYLLEAQMPVFEGIVEDKRTTMGHVQIADLKRLTCLVPAAETQKRIAEVLGALDDAIEVSRSLIESLESSIQLEAAAVLQSAGEGSQLLTDVATIVNGYSYKSSELVDDSDTALVNLKNFDRRGGFRLDGLKPFEGAHKAAQALSAGDAIVAKTDLTQGAEVIGRCLRMPALPQFEKYVASLDIAIVRSKGEIPQPVICALLAQPEFPDHCLGFVNGTTVLHMSKAALETYTLPMLAPEQVANLADRIEALAGQQDRAFVELHHLQQLRDFLLPRLISGELRVTDAEKTVEEVL